MSMLRVLNVPAFEDNYLWLIHNGRDAAVIDPGDAAPILEALAANRLSLVAILLTHHHADHTGGVIKLLESNPVPVVGPAHENIPGITRPVVEGDIVALPELGLTLSVLDVPGHTHGHVAYVAQEMPWLFCGDVLFAGGCGRLREGPPAQMKASLEKLAALSDETLVYCGHEYTVANLRFAKTVEPDNAALTNRLESALATRAAGKPTVPSTIALEKQTNPFLRCDEPEIIDRLLTTQRIENREPLEVFTALRNWKNVFP